MTRARVVIGALLVAAACSRGDSVAYTGPHASDVRPAIRAIERSTGHKYKTPPKLEDKTHEEVRAFLERSMNEEMPALELAGAEASYKRFGLLPDSIDLRRTLLDLLAEQVVGYYDPKTKVLYVVRDARPEYVGITIQHELVHALQDQYFPLDSLLAIEHDNDRRTAAQAVVEGQAVWEQLIVMTGGANPESVMPGGWDAIRQRIREDHTDMPKLANAPMLLREDLLFPYLSGAEYVRQLKTRNATGWPFDSLPESTEQILHADKAFGVRDHPMRVTLPAPKSGGSVAYENDLGEFETRLYIYQFTKDLNLAARAAAGWGGDRYRLMSLGARGEALVWATAWDSPLDAAEFVEALGTVLPVRYKGLQRRGDGTDRRRFEGGGRTVEVVAVTVDGHSVVLLTDVPAGVAPDLVDPAQIRLSH